MNAKQFWKVTIAYLGDWLAEEDVMDGIVVQLLSN